MKNSTERVTAKSTGSNQPLDVPLHEVTHVAGNCAYFLIQTCNKYYWWKYYDQHGNERCQTNTFFKNIPAVMNDIKDLQKRIGDQETPILRVI